MLSRFLWCTLWALVAGMQGYMLWSVLMGTSSMSDLRLGAGSLFATALVISVINVVNILFEE